MNFWTYDRENKLTLLVADGFSASQIAEALGGVTRNAVIGKARRMGLQLKGGAKPKKKCPPPKIFKPALKIFKPRVLKFKPMKESARVEIACHPVTLTDRGRGCAFPVSGDGADTLFCAGHTDGARYCAQHRGVMYDKPKPPSVQKSAMRAYLYAARR